MGFSLEPFCHTKTSLYILLTQPPKCYIDVLHDKMCMDVAPYHNLLGASSSTLKSTGHRFEMALLIVSCF